MTILDTTSDQAKSPPHRHPALPVANPDDRTLTRQLAYVLLFALLLRLGYQAAMPWFGGSYHNGSDSGKYLEVAHAMLTGGVVETDRAPFYMFFLFLVFKIVGSESFRAVVTAQSFLDTLSVLAIALSARAFGRQLVIPSAIVAAIIPNFIVHSSYVLSETLFLFFFAWGICALLWAIRGKSPVLLFAVSGMLFGLSLWTRLALTFYPFFFIPAVLIALRLDQKLSWLRCAGLALVTPAAMAVTMTPLLIYNYLVYDHAALTSQQGEHLIVVYGWLATPWFGADRLAVRLKLMSEVAAYIKTIGGDNANTFAVGAFMQKLAFERILELPPWQIAWGVSWGAFKNLMQTGFYQVLSQFNQPLTFFSTMRAPTVPGRIYEFMQTNWNSPFMVMWVISQVTLVFSRLVQAFGAVTGLRRAEFRGLTLFLLATIAYFLAINGPIADPKYRIPIEPALILLFALGLTQNPTVLRCVRCCRSAARIPS